MKTRRHKFFLPSGGPLQESLPPLSGDKNLCLLVFSLTLLFSAFVSSAFAYQSPGSPTGFVNDFAGILVADQRVTLETKLAALEKETLAEVSVVTITTLGDETVETYAVRLFEEWGIGKERTDNGLLILIAPNDREARIEVGYGLEPVVTDVASSVIMREIMIPAFKEGNYFGGIDSALDLIIGLVKNDQETIQYISSNTDGGDLFSRSFDLSFIFPFLLILIVQLIPAVVYSKPWWLGGVLGFVLGFSIFLSIVPVIVLTIIGLVFDYLLSKKFGGKRPPGSRGGVWWGGMGGGRSGGGFGGFGGGMSGGGGAGGRW